MASASELWAEILDFAKPAACPCCASVAEITLDDHGYYCERCGDEIPNGCEFDEMLERYRAAKAEGRANG